MSIYDMSTSPEVPSFDSSASASNSAATLVIISSVIICNGRRRVASREARAASHHKQKKNEDSGPTNELECARLCVYYTEHPPRNEVLLTRHFEHGHLSRECNATQDGDAPQSASRISRSQFPCSSLPSRQPLAVPAMVNEKQQSVWDCRGSVPWWFTQEPSGLSRHAGLACIMCWH